MIVSCAELGAPVIGIGGIDLDSVDTVRAAGANGVAVIRAVWQSDDPAVAVRRLVRALERQQGASHGSHEEEARGR